MQCRDNNDCTSQEPDCVNGKCSACEISKKECDKTGVISCKDSTLKTCVEDSQICFKIKEDNCPKGCSSNEDKCKEDDCNNIGDKKCADNQPSGQPGLKQVCEQTNQGLSWGTPIPCAFTGSGNPEACSGGECTSCGNSKCDCDKYEANPSGPPSSGGGTPNWPSCYGDNPDNMNGGDGKGVDPEKQKNAGTGDGSGNGGGGNSQPSINPEDACPGSQAAAVDSNGNVLGCGGSGAIEKAVERLKSEGVDVDSKTLYPTCDMCGKSSMLCDQGCVPLSSDLKAGGYTNCKQCSNSKPGQEPKCPTQNACSGDEKKGNSGDGYYQKCVDIKIKDIPKDPCTGVPLYPKGCKVFASVSCKQPPKEDEKSIFDGTSGCIIVPKKCESGPDKTKGCESECSAGGGGGSGGDSGNSEGSSSQTGSEGDPVMPPLEVWAARQMQPQGNNPKVADPNDVYGFIKKANEKITAEKITPLINKGSAEQNLKEQQQNADDAKQAALDEAKKAANEKLISAAGLLGVGLDWNSPKTAEKPYLGKLAPSTEDLGGWIGKTIAGVVGIDNYLNFRSNEFVYNLLGSPYAPLPEEVRAVQLGGARMNDAGVLGTLMGGASYTEKPFQEDSSDSTLTKIGKGVVNGLTEFVSGAFLNPFGLATMGTGGTGNSLLSRGLSGTFAADMAIGAVSSGSAAVDSISRGDWQGAAENLVGMIGAGYFGYGTAKHALGVEGVGNSATNRAGETETSPATSPVVAETPRAVEAPRGGIWDGILNAAENARGMIKSGIETYRASPLGAETGAVGSAKIGPDAVGRRSTEPAPSEPTTSRTETPAAGTAVTGRDLGKAAEPAPAPVSSGTGTVELPAAAPKTQTPYVKVPIDSTAKTGLEQTRIEAKINAEAYQERANNNRATNPDLAAKQQEIAKTAKDIVNKVDNIIGSEDGRVKPKDVWSGKDYDPLKAQVDKANKLRDNLKTELAKSASAEVPSAPPAQPAAKPVEAKAPTSTGTSSVKTAEPVAAKPSTPSAAPTAKPTAEPTISNPVKDLQSNLDKVKELNRDTNNPNTDSAGLNEASNKLKAWQDWVKNSDLPVEQKANLDKQIADAKEVLAQKAEIADLVDNEWKTNVNDKTAKTVLEEAQANFDKVKNNPPEAVAAEKTVKDAQANADARAREKSQASADLVSAKAQLDAIKSRQAREAANPVPAAAPTAKPATPTPVVPVDVKTPRVVSTPAPKAGMWPKVKVPEGTSPAKAAAVQDVSKSPAAKSEGLWARIKDGASSIFGGKGKDAERAVKPAVDNSIQAQLRKNAQDKAEYGNMKTEKQNTDPLGAGDDAIKNYNDLTKPDATGKTLSEKVTDLWVRLNKAKTLDESAQIAGELNSAAAELGRKIEDSGIKKLQGKEIETYAANLNKIVEGAQNTVRETTAAGLTREARDARAQQIKSDLEKANQPEFVKDSKGNPIPTGRKLLEAEIVTDKAKDRSSLVDSVKVDIQKAITDMKQELAAIEKANIREDLKKTPGERIADKFNQIIN